MRRRWVLWLILALAPVVGFAVVTTCLYRPTPPVSKAVKPQDAVSGVVAQYVLATEGWLPEVYTIENTNRVDEDGNLIINVIHQDDLRSATPGGGKSLQLHVDPRAKRVVRMLRFQ